ncbi:hypothetical protein Taro_052622, partial [Colocasia esculenta]|nr:hypothetical protein [Colocasia esculenta]
GGLKPHRMEGGRLLWGVLEDESSGKRGHEEVGVEEEVLKRKIKCHPMFGILKETHLNCLKICSGNEEASGAEPDQLQRSKAKQEDHSDLDAFMEAYHSALVGLAREIQKPMQEATAFMELMYCLLDDVASSSHSPAGARGSTAE